MYHFTISHSNSFNPVAQIVCQMHWDLCIPLHSRQVKILFDFGDNGNYPLANRFCSHLEKLCSILRSFPLS